ncbi:anti-sigma factor [Halosquirtibacter xylanolyticus]|uniref:anti-sigma factor n=1 Tax=Halosquirtibacter xylanolyticus TaxID=3374599 RepID=UPI0037488ADB|nr:anti-sigma factor [Prolixibacteraceae bacterium]
MRILRYLTLAVVLAFVAVSCDNEDDNVTPMNGDFNVKIDGLADLGADFTYEGWAIVDGAPVSVGTFNVDGDGRMSTNSFTLDRASLNKASAFVVTIEPMQDADPAPSKVHILGGSIVNGEAMLSVDHATALGVDLTSAMGKYILATPTNGADTNEKSGIWFLDLASGAPMVGLTLPTLPDGWIYEGWAVINGQPVSTGKFSSVSTVDQNDPFSGEMAGPPFPGEDFLHSAPDGLMFPTDISGGKAVISIEPVPDNSAAPFLLKPLFGSIPADAMDHVNYPLDNNAAATNPTGSVKVSM